ncbi:hypothetical protein EHP00_453 [Ecytonucleospora hepatopenaei]|uniref:SCP domain-containing protein n=1 Tax=Ecytonucleospora hepatopenaei TaxID=646526 RepID=A0A1W0E8X9_9MICR|nr:hypothetical protein EHP00_453 [Ecytonucleospora hepatopenaei]
MLFYMNLFFFVNWIITASLDIKNEMQMTNFINVLRKHNNMEELIPDSAILKVAKDQVEHMCKINKLTHASKNLESLNNRLKNAGLKVVRSGENIALQHRQGKTESYTEVAKMWYKSKDHRKNMLGDFAYTAVASCSNGKEKYWIQIFAKPYSNKEIKELGEKKTTKKKNTEPEKTVKKKRKTTTKSKQKENNEFDYKNLLEPSYSEDSPLQDKFNKTPAIKTVTISKTDEDLKKEISKMLKANAKTKTVTVKAADRQMPHSSTVQNKQNVQTVTVTKNITEYVSTTPNSVLNTANNTSNNNSMLNTANNTSNNNSMLNTANNTSNSILNTSNSSILHPKSEFIQMIPEIVKELKHEIYKEIGKEELSNVTSDSLNEKNNQQQSNDESDSQNLLDTIKQNYSFTEDKDKEDSPLPMDEDTQPEISRKTIKKIVKEVISEIKEQNIEIA